MRGNRPSWALLAASLYWWLSACHSGMRVQRPVEAGSDSADAGRSSDVPAVEWPTRDDAWQSAVDGSREAQPAMDAQVVFCPSLKYDDCGPDAYCYYDPVPCGGVEPTTGEPALATLRAPARCVPLPCAYPGCRGSCATDLECFPGEFCDVYSECYVLGIDPPPDVWSCPTGCLVTFPTHKWGHWCICGQCPR